LTLTRSAVNVDAIVFWTVWETAGRRYLEVSAYFDAVTSPPDRSA